MKIVVSTWRMMDTYTQPVPPKRRYLEFEQKRRIVEETFAEGASVAQIARAHGVNANLVFNWRKLYRAGQLCGRNESKLLPVRVSAEDTPRHWGHSTSVAYVRWPLLDVRLFRTAALDCSRSRRTLLRDCDFVIQTGACTVA